jgi:hypothetical protein
VSPDYLVRAGEQRCRLGPDVVLHARWWLACRHREEAGQSWEHPGVVDIDRDSVEHTGVPDPLCSAAHRRELSPVEFPPSNLLKLSNLTSRTPFVAPITNECW